ncbi:spexin prohormone 2 isoform X3 [Clinocottus analis]|uniref:spexin prohormone 2 isoform X3 n=1 Tax=Clinocottus analis TaxID=304258 RepID=UPI0035C1F5C0
MNRSMAEPDRAQHNRGHMYTDGQSPPDCGSEKDGDVLAVAAGTRPVWAGSPSDVSVAGIRPDLHQNTSQPGLSDPLFLRWFHSPCQSQSSQYHFLTGLGLTSPVPGPPDGSQNSSASDPWLPNEPILCSIMSGDLHDPFASICVPQPVDHQQFHEGLTEFTSHITQPVVCKAGGDGEAVLVNPCEQAPVFLSLTSAQGNDKSVLGTPSQIHQTSCPLYESRDTQPQAPPARPARSLCDSKSRKPCHCTRSQCLKLYCECFANGVMCSNCDCSNCHNNAEHEVNHLKAIKVATRMPSSPSLPVGSRERSKVGTAKAATANAPAALRTTASATRPTSCVPPAVTALAAKTTMTESTWASKRRPSSANGPCRS